MNRTGYTEKGRQRIVHFIPGLDHYSGTAAFCVGAADAMHALGADVTVAHISNPDVLPSSGVKVIRSRKGLSGIGFRPGFVHVHCPWRIPAIRAMAWCALHRIPFALSPHGGFMPRVFSKGRLKKRIVFTLLLKPLLRFAKFIHCTSEEEAQACGRLGLSSPTVIAPPGTELPEEAAEKEVNAHGGRIALFVGRLSEEKGLETLLDAWNGIKRRMEGAAEGWKLVIAGPDCRGLEKRLKRKISSAGIPDVEMSGPADAAEKDALYRQADLFVLPSPMENFSIAVLDALAYGVPVICTKGTPWRVVDGTCGWWVDQGTEPLRRALESAMAMEPEDLRSFGAGGRRIAAENFPWEDSARTLLDAYAG